MTSPPTDPYFLVKAQVRAFSQGGTCLSNDCSGADDILNWSCQHGHQWQEQLGTVLRGNWCPTCEHQQATNSTIRSKRR